MEREFQSVDELKSYLCINYDMDPESLETLDREELEGLLATMEMSMNVPDTVPQHNSDLGNNAEVVNNLVDDVGSANADNMGEEAIITQFCDVTGSERDSARHFLQAFGFELDSAISMFFQSEQPVPSNVPHFSVPPSAHHSQSASGSMPNQASLSTADDDSFSSNFFANMVSSQSGPMAEGDLPNISASLQRFMQARGGLQHQYSDDEEDVPRTVQYDEEGIRRPDPVRQQRLMTRQSSLETEEDVLARADDPSVDWMFPPPRHLSYMGSLEQARSIANSENRWVLVNIQSHNEFTSHLLNRDVWTNDTIESLFRTSFLFWQRGHTTRDGQDYMRMHKVTEDDLPHIGFIDPRTGAKLLTLTGLMEASDLAIRMVEFVEKHPLGQTRTATSSPAVSLNAASNNQSSNQSNNQSSSSSAKMEEGIAASSYTNSPVTLPPPPQSVAEVVPPAVPTVSFGAVPVEPSDLEAGVIKVSIKLISGKTSVRKYLSSDSVQSLFAVALSLEPEAASRHFDLVTRYPALSLVERLESTLGDCNLAGVQVIMKWV